MVSVLPFAGIFIFSKLLEQVDSRTNFTVFRVCLMPISVLLVYTALGFSAKLLAPWVTQGLGICPQTKFVFFTCKTRFVSNHILICLATLSCHATVLGIAQIF